MHGRLLRCSSVAGATHSRGRVPPLLHPCLPPELVDTRAYGKSIRCCCCCIVGAFSSPPASFMSVVKDNTAVKGGRKLANTCRGWSLFTLLQVAQAVFLLCRSCVLSQIIPNWFQPHCTPPPPHAVRRDNNHILVELMLSRMLHGWFQQSNVDCCFVPKTFM